MIVALAPMAVAGAEANGDGFREAAQEYEALAEESREFGDSEAAPIYDRLAEIKTDAAELADEGRWNEIDWTEYHQLQEELYGEKKN
jgi:hypothetical protein